MTQRIAPRAIEPSAVEGHVLTTVDGVAVWVVPTSAELVEGTRVDLTVDEVANTITVEAKRQVVLLEVGQTAADVPADTPVGAIIFRKA